MNMSIRQSLYGLKQAPHAWYQKIDTYLQEEGLETRDANYKMYNMQGDKITILVLPYVENILMIRNLKVKIAWLISQLQSKFEMSTFG